MPNPTLNLTDIIFIGIASAGIYMIALGVTDILLHTLSTFADKISGVGKKEAKSKYPIQKFKKAAKRP